MLTNLRCIITLGAKSGKLEKYKDINSKATKYD